MRSATGPLVSIAQPILIPPTTYAKICFFLKNGRKGRIIPKKINRLNQGSIMPDLK